MPSFAFWNVNRKDLGSAACLLTESCDLDLLVLCESKSDPDRVVAGLNMLKRGHYAVVSTLEDRFQIYSRFRQDLVRPRFDAPRCSVVTIDLPGVSVINLMLIHANSANYHSDKSISLELLEMAKTLRMIEREDGHSRSVVVGDFNQNPYSDGLLAANGFHAIMDAKEARKGHRRVQSTDWDYFYNPMWGLLGDHSKGPPGTHYYRGSGLLEQQWHMLDQVIVRPSLLDHFDPERVSIVTNLGAVDLLTMGRRPHRGTFSDHLPIYFEINT
jgi:hypothetical protein